MASGATVRLSPIQPPSIPAPEGPGGRGEPYPVGPELASHAVVSRGGTSFGQGALGTSSSPGPSESGTGGPVSSLSAGAQALGLAPERAGQLGFGLKQSVV